VKRERKEIAIAKLQSNYKSLKANWHDPETTFPEFEFWMQGEINNARLGTVADYNDLVPLFEKVYARHGEDLPSFFETCRDLANLTADLRISRLESLAAGS
jgi:predicted aminopeptidase